MEIIEIKKDRNIVVIVFVVIILFLLFMFCKGNFTVDIFKVLFLSNLILGLFMREGYTIPIQ